MAIVSSLVLRRNTDGTIYAMRLPEAVRELAALLSVAEYESRMEIAAALTSGQTIRARGCTYRLEGVE